MKCSYTIIGFSGVGKSYSAKVLQETFKNRVAVIDSDCYLSQNWTQGQTPAQFIQRHGIAKWRQLEEQFFTWQQTQKSLCFLGGGAIEIPLIQHYLDEEPGRFIWLDRPFEICWSQINSDGLENRPLMSSKEKAMKIFQQRLKWYQKAAIRCTSTKELKATLEQLVE